MHFYLVEYHPYTRCFSFIAQYSGALNPSFANVFISNSYGEPIDNAWVERKAEGGELILAGSSILASHLLYSDLQLLIEHKNGVKESFRFPSPSYIDAGIIALEKSDVGFNVLHWAKDSISSCMLNKKTILNSVHSDKFSNVECIKSLCEDPINENTVLNTYPPQSVPVGLAQYKTILGNDISDERILEYKNIYNSEEAWLIGNGPSVDLSILECLQDKVTFGFNRLYLSYPNTVFRPTYTVSGDLQMINDFGEEIISNNEGATFLASSEKPTLKGDSIWLRQLNMFPSLFSLNPQNFVTPGGSSPFVAMQLAAFMGIKRLYLYGFDFDYIMETVGYDSGTIKVSGENNHFIDNYRSGKSWYPPSYRNIAHSFWSARIYFESLGGEIINCSETSKLDIFRKTKLYLDK